MESKEAPAGKNPNMENAHQEKDGKEQDINKGEALALPLEAGEYCVPRCRWDMIQRLGERQARMREENFGRIGAEVRLLIENTRGKQWSHGLRAVSTKPPQRDHHVDFCLMP
ncbi:protein BEX1-like [Echinops telfairi]|uniref:Protein BEX1-like n=2 Tax=Echinops telfairi TaxID=9371 RepID=A0AC55D482_ECHTE|nr:protein BEX1-like [Echinops telfairi]XP_045146557.1 protein BEX1-like [Echinops telfairi]